MDGPTGNATAAALDVPSHRVGRKALAHVIADDFPRPFARDVTITFHGVYVEGDRVIVEETMSATPASGKAYVNDYCCVFELHGGLVHRVREYMDTAWCSTRPPNLGLSGGGHDGLPNDQRDNSHHRPSRVPEAPQLRTLTMPHVQRDRTSMHMVDGAASQLARSRGRPPGSPDAWP